MRHSLTLAAAAVFGLFFAADASACHKKKCACPTEPVCAAPAPVACAPAPVACAPAKKCGFKLHLGCKKKAVSAPVCETVAYASAPVMASGQTYASGQGY